MARCIAMAAAVVALFALPSAFVPARQGAPAVSPAVAAGVAAGSMALPAWAYDMADAQILLARVPGGKRTKELGLVVPIPEEDGLTDGQIAALFVVALVGLIAAVDLGKTLYYGINPTKFKTAKGKGSITPFMKRLIENGYWVMTTCTGLFLSGLKFFKCLGSRVQTWPGQCIESKTVKLRAWKSWKKGRSAANLGNETSISG